MSCTEYQRLLGLAGQAADSIENLPDIAKVTQTQAAIAALQDSFFGAPLDQIKTNLEAVVNQVCQQGAVVLRDRMNGLCGSESTWAVDLSVASFTDLESERSIVCRDTDGTLSYVGGDRDSQILNYGIYYSRNYYEGVSALGHENDPCSTHVASALAAVGLLSQEAANSCYGTGTLLKELDEANFVLVGSPILALRDETGILRSEIPTIPTDGYGEYIVPGTVVMHLDQGANKRALGQRPHAALVVGWGDPNATWRGSIPPLYPTQEEAEADGIHNPIPYVTDRGVRGDDTLSPDGIDSDELRGPRPYNQHFPYYVRDEGDDPNTDVDDDPNVTSAYEFYTPSN